MIAIDHYILDFLRGNTLTVILALGLLKGIARLTPSVVDDKVATLLQGVFRLARPNNKEGVGPMDDSRVKSGA